MRSVHSSPDDHLVKQEGPRLLQDEHPLSVEQVELSSQYWSRRRRRIPTGSPKRNLPQNSPSPSSKGALHRSSSTSTVASKGTMKTEQGETDVLRRHAPWSIPPLAFRRSTMSDVERKKNKYYPSVTPLPSPQNRRAPRRQLLMSPPSQSSSSVAAASSTTAALNRLTPSAERQQTPLQQQPQLAPAARQKAREKIALSIAKHFPDKRDREKLAQILQSKRNVQSRAQETSSKEEEEEDAPVKQLTREEIATSIMQRFPNERDLEKVVRLLQARHGSVGKGTTTTAKTMEPPRSASPKQLSREEVAASIARRFPNDLDKVVRFLKSQQDTFKKLEGGEDGVVAAVESPQSRGLRSATLPTTASASSSEAGVGRPSKTLSREKDVKSVATARFPEQRDRKGVTSFFRSKQRQGDLRTSSSNNDDQNEPSPNPRRKSGRLCGGADSGELLCQPVVPRRVPVCQCCYEDVHTAPVVRCSTGVHSFCSNCIKRYVETWVYGEPYPIQDIPGQEEGSFFKALPCLSGGCTEGYLPHEAVQGANSEQVWESYQEKMFHVMSLKDDVTQSTKPAPKSPPVHVVGNDEDEGTEEESVSSSVDQGYRTVEEAMTEAKLRRCPECRTPFLKESGYCNKIRCPSCRTAVCYICRQKVESRGYDHFCVHSYDSCNQKCGKCSLWTNKDDKVDQERLRLVATNEANRMWEQSLLGSDDSSAVVELDVERLLQPPKTSSSSSSSKAGPKKKALLE